ncbi:putative ribonuclease H-like domain-containing protein [Tanacetum coccineum]
MEAHCIALELKYQNQALKLGQHGQILNETSNKANIKKEIDVLETMNIELEHSVAKLRKENETLKKHYKDLYDSIKITRSKTIEQTTSLLANNADLKAQIQEKVFTIAALKNELRKLKGNSVDTKNSSKNMPRFCSNDMVHNHYLDEARKKTQERDRNSKTSVMPFVRFQSTADGSKPKPKSTNHSTRSLPTADPPFSESSKDSPDDGFKPSREEEKKDAKDPRNKGSKVPSTEEPQVNHEKDANVNITNTNNTVKEIGRFSDADNDDSGADINNLDTYFQVSLVPTIRIHKDHHLNQVIGDLQSATQTRQMTKNLEEYGFISTTLKQRTCHKDLQNCLFTCFLSQEEPKKTLVELPNGKRAIGTKWVFRNKNDEKGIMIKNKARLVAQGYTQEERIDYDEVFAPVSRIEAIRLFLAYASFKDFVVYQMDVKSAFLYGKIEEEVYVFQPPRFEDPDFPDRVYKVEKARYGLHQAPRACQDKYVTDILKKFGYSDVMTAITPMETYKTLLKDEKGEDVDEHLYRSMIGSLMYLTSSRPDIMFVVCACARFQVNPKISNLHAVKRIFRYLKGQPKLGLWYPKGSPFDLVAYTDSDYAAASLDRKSTTGGCQFLRCRLISWQCKKHIVVANSTTEAEYVAALSCCGQVLCIQNQLLDYGLLTTAGSKLMLLGINLLLLVMVNAANVTSPSESTVRTDLHLEDAEGIDCLPNNTIFEELTRMGFSSIMASALICLARNQKFNFSKYIFERMANHTRILSAPCHTKNFFGNTKREGKSFSGRVTPLFPIMMVQAQEELGKGSTDPTDPQHTPIITQPSTSQPQKKQSRRKHRKNAEVPQPSDPTEPIADKAPNKESVPTHSNDPLLSGEDRLKLNELMELCTTLQSRVLDLEHTKTAQAQEITSLKKRVKKLEKKKKLRTQGLKRLYKVGLSARIISYEDEGLGDQEDASKQGRIDDINTDQYIYLVNVHRGEDMFRVNDLDGDEVIVEAANVVEETVDAAKVSIATTISTEEITLAQALIEIRSTKPKKKGLLKKKLNKLKKTI